MSISLRTHLPGSRLTIAPCGAASLALALVIILSAGASIAVAQEPAPGLYDRPVLAIDPGMHTAPIIRAAVDRAGRIAVTGSDDKTVRLWRMTEGPDGKAGALIRTIRMPTGPGNVGKVYAVAISPDGTTVAAGGWTRWTPQDPEQQVYLFDAATGRMTARLDGLPNVVLDLAFSPDGSRLAAVLHAGGMRLWRADAGRWIAEAADPDYGDQSYGVAFAPDGRFATTSYDGRLRLYAPDGARLAETDSGFARPFGLAFNPADGRLAVGFDDTTAVRLFDGEALASLAAPDTGGIDIGDLSKVVWSADGATLYAAGRFVGDTVEDRVIAWRADGMRTRLPGSLNTVMSVAALPDGALLVAAGDPFLGVVGADGSRRWTRRPLQMDPRGQRSNLGVSSDAATVDFGFDYEGERRARFDVATLTLTAPAADGRTAPPRQDGLAVTDWVNSATPTLAGTPLRLEPYEWSTSLAIHPDGGRFVLGADFTLRAFDAGGTELWQRTAPSAVWAVNIAAERDLVVAVHADGTIRWHRLDDGTEVLAFFPFADGSGDWIAWEPKGRYAGTLRATRALRWVVNRGWDEVPEEFRAGRIPDSYEPEIIRRIIPAGSLGLAMEAASDAKRNEAFRELAGGFVPGAKLHTLTIGVGQFEREDTHSRLSLRYAEQDAADLDAALARQVDWPYQPGFAVTLTGPEATAQNIDLQLEALRAKLAQSPPGEDLAVITFSGHGVVSGTGPLEEFYLITNDTDDRRPEMLRNTALSGTDLRRHLAALGDYGRILVVIDACSSGKLSAGGGKGGVRDELVRDLASSNVTVFASSAATEVSREDESWLNGAFTETVLEGLTKADDSDSNGFVSVEELAAYVRQRLPTLSGEQTPTIETRFGGDLFAVGLCGGDTCAE